MAPIFFEIKQSFSLSCFLPSSKLAFLERLYQLVSEQILGQFSVWIGTIECSCTLPGSELHLEAAMVVSDNTRTAEQRRLEEFFQQMQNSMESFKDQMQQSMEALKTQQGQEVERLREFVTGLSMEVSQVAHHYRGAGEGFSGSGSGNPNHNLSRLTRVEFPKFWGEDVQGWIYKCEQFFEVDNVEEGMKVRICLLYTSPSPRD